MENPSRDTGAAHEIPTNMEGKLHAGMMYSFGPYRIAGGERVLRYRGEPVVLASKAVDVLLALLAESECFVSKTELMDRVWPGSYVDEANLTQNIYLLRKMFSKHQSGVRIDNIPKQGYRIVLPGRVQPAAVARKSYAALACTVACVVATLSAAAYFGALRPSGNLEGNALREYMLARSYQDMGFPKNLQRSVALFKSAMREKPGSALPYAGLAISDASLAYYAADEMHRTQLQAEALTLAHNAVRLDAGSADAYAALGGTEYSIEHDSVAAGAALRRALEINPHQVNALVWYGSILLDEGHVASARHLLTRAVGIAPNSSGTVATLAWSDFIARDYLGAIELSNQDLTSAGGASSARITLANAYLMSGNYARASDFAALLVRQAGTRVTGMALKAHLDAAAGKYALAALELRKLTADPREIGSWDAASIAAAYLALGDRPRAFVWLARVRPWERGQILRDPRFAVLTHDHAFASWASG